MGLAVRFTCSQRILVKNLNLFTCLRKIQVHAFQNPFGHGHFHFPFYHFDGWSPDASGLGNQIPHRFRPACRQGYPFQHDGHVFVPALPCRTASAPEHTGPSGVNQQPAVGVWHHPRRVQPNIHSVQKF